MPPASQKSVNKEAEDKTFYKLTVVWDPKMGMQIQQNSNKVGPADIIMCLEVVKGLHTKYFVDIYSEQIAKIAKQQMDPETKQKFDEAMAKTLDELGLNPDGSKKVV